MMDLTLPRPASPQSYTVPVDPGRTWVKDPRIVIDAPPDTEVDPAPDGRWPTSAIRTGRCGVVSPRALRMADGSYRLYYTQIRPRPGFPAGANDYDTSTSRILSASSADGDSWTPDPGVRLTPQQGAAGDLRVVSSEVVAVPGESGSLRMYFECCPGSQSAATSIRSAISDDGGWEWELEPGVRLDTGDRGVNTPRITYLQDGGVRLYFYERDRGVLSAVSRDGGLTFAEEPGIRIEQNGPLDSTAAFSPEVMKIAGGGYRMYYAGYSANNRAQILAATSEDGFTWHKEAEPAIVPTEGAPDAAKCSELSILQLPGRSGGSRLRIFYEACDGTAVNQRGVWRIMSAVAELSL
ncbi:exo-alpha-sialidase [Nakamurella lactea]|uniref:exo-alpha-sialidase n=1 Tax=Nakamurella lactea TaxID=459515 RepID=UPI0004916D8A|nr:exo-alpha-sialidase [Nakamurella lactea]